MTLDWTKWPPTTRHRRSAQLLPNMSGMSHIIESDVWSNGDVVIQSKQCYDILLTKYQAYKHANERESCCGGIAGLCMTCYCVNQNICSSSIPTERCSVTRIRGIPQASVWSWRITFCFVRWTSCVTSRAERSAGRKRQGQWACAQHSAFPITSPLWGETTSQWSCVYYNDALIWKHLRHFYGWKSAGHRWNPLAKTDAE